MSNPAGSCRASGRVLIVDDDPLTLDVIEAVMTRKGYEVTRATNGAEAVDRIHQLKPDVVLLDVQMPVLDGIETCRRLKSDQATALTPVILVTGLQDIEDRVRGLEAGADDFLSKPIVLAELAARVGSLVRLKRFTDELDSAQSVIRSLALTIESRDPYTGGHCERLAHYATTFGRELGLDAATLNALHLGGYLHDVGKIGIPDSILLKPSPLTAEERRIMEGHTVIGETLVAELRSLERVRVIVRHHHERMDGSGYPDGLAGAAFPIEAQIMSIVDGFDAIVTDRPYRAARTDQQACNELVAEAACGWKDPALVQEFITLVENGALKGVACHVA